MTDIATRFGPDAATGTAALRADWLLGGNGLAVDDGLQTATLISLYTDRLAHADDTLPEPVFPGAVADRRGWWADGLGPAEDASDRIGSRIWLLARARRTDATLRLAEGYAQEALAWMLDDGIAQSVQAEAVWGGDRLDQLRLTIAIHRAAALPARFDFLWQTETGA